MICGRRLFKGNSYEICLPLTDTGVTSVRLYTRGDIIIEKEPVITGDSMCFSFAKEELDVLPDGVLRYEAVTEYDTIDTNTPYVIVTPGDYSGTTLDEMLEEAYHSGYTDGYDDGQEQCVHDYSKDYLTIEIPEEYYSGDLIIRGTPQYSVNGGEWTMAENPTTIHLSTGDKVRFKGINQGNNLFFSFSLIFKAYGNIMSLIYGDDFIGQTSLLVPNAFEYCFSGCAGLFDISNLILPATTLSEACYSRMFGGCSFMEAPALPATTLAKRCYRYMFDGCTNLTTAPELPATTLADSCYGFMFNDCTSLTKAPSLPATTLTDACYGGMFHGCTSLTTAPELPANRLKERCYDGMFSGCTSLMYIKCLATTNFSASFAIYEWLQDVSPVGIFVKASGVTWPTGVSGIPSGWTVVDS